MKFLIHVTRREDDVSELRLTAEDGRFLMLHSPGDTVAARLTTRADFASRVEVADIYADAFLPTHKQTAHKQSEPTLTAPQRELLVRIGRQGVGGYLLTSGREKWLAVALERDGYAEMSNSMNRWVLTQKGHEAFVNHGFEPGTLADVFSREEGESCGEPLEMLVGAAVKAEEALKRLPDFRGAVEVTVGKRDVALAWCPTESGVYLVRAEVLGEDADEKGD